MIENEKIAHKLVLDYDNDVIMTHDDLERAIKAALDQKDLYAAKVMEDYFIEREARQKEKIAHAEEVKELNDEILKLVKAEVEIAIEARNNYCPCCHCRLDEICGPCKWCKDKKNHLDTERSMYRAWRKRAEEAEVTLTSLRSLLNEAIGALEKIFEHEVSLGYSSGCSKCCEVANETLTKLRKEIES